MIEPLAVFGWIGLTIFVAARAGWPILLGYAALTAAGILWLCSAVLRSTDPSAGDGLFVALLFFGPAVLVTLIRAFVLMRRN